jgi:hypothetical protein
MKQTEPLISQSSPHLALPPVTLDLAPPPGPAGAGTDALAGALAGALAAAAEQLTDELAQARDLAAVEAAFARLLGSAPVQAARALEPGSDQALAARAGFRCGLARLYAEAGSWGHSLGKPYGYPGDFGILELVYDHAAHRDTRAPWAALVDVWGTHTELPRAVAARKDVLRAWIERYLDDCPADAPARLLSIASGAAREIRELSMRHLERGRITLVDTDARALAFAASSLCSLPRPLDIEIVVGDAIRGAGLENVKARAPFDVIYALGLFDYLPEALVVRVMKRFASMLESDGRFLFCLKDARRYDAFFYDWFFDWCFVPRTVEDGGALAAQAGLEVTDVLSVEGGTIHIFVCTAA